jgi:hypothetical protein
MPWNAGLARFSETDRTEVVELAMITVSDRSKSLRRLSALEAYTYSPFEGLLCEALRTLSGTMEQQDIAVTSST